MGDNKKEVKRYDILFSHYQRYLKNLLRNYFIWEGLPETIDKRALEELLLFKGQCICFRWDEAKDKRYKGQLVVTEGALAGIPDALDAVQH